MRLRFPRGGTVFCAALFIFIITLCLFVGVFEWSGRAYTKVSLNFTYYFLVRDCDTATAGAVAGDSYFAGGAGYLLESEDAVVLACYYKDTDAAFVEGTMSEKGIDVRILEKQTKSFALNGESTAEKSNIEANAKTLDTISRMLFDIANGLERMDASQGEARAALQGAINSLEGLSAGNTDSCYELWNVALMRTVRRCKEIAEGIVFAKDIRYLQVSLCVTVLSLEDYFA